MAPAPIAMTVSSAAISLFSPRAVIMDAESENMPMIPAVVVMATVEDPCAVLRMAEIRKGKKMPTLARKSAFAFMNSTKPAAVITLPSTPPAAVMKRMGPTVFIVSSVTW